MNEQDKIPVTRLARTTKFVGTGAKLGANYLKHYATKLITGEDDREQLNQNNATDVYNTLSELKGSALKVAQMLSMDKGLLPAAYSDKFSQAQYSAPPLSYPLVMNTFRKSLGKNPTQLFDSFSSSAKHAASIGQVHEATLNNKKLAVKIQYPGVAESISSDIKIIKPVVIRMFNLNAEEVEHYVAEVKDRLIEETDYRLELQRGNEIGSQFKALTNVVFPKYYPEYSSDRILTMDWIEGVHLDKFLAQNPTQEFRNEMGQAMWDFYDYQIHKLRKVHADPHPGNFLFTPDKKLGVIDFGCVKELPNDFYVKYFKLVKGHLLPKPDFENLLFELKFLLPSDKGDLKDYLFGVMREMIELLGTPFQHESFDFSDDEYFNKIYNLGEVYSKDKTLKNAGGARGPQDAIYINRTYFGLYSILNKLQAKIETRSYAAELELV